MTRRRHHLSDMQKAILAKAYHNDFRLMKPEQMSARMWMTHISKFAERGLIMYEGRVPTLSFAGMITVRHHG